ncbi:MAG: 4-hydroxy-tetrahydrodipicolinate reductase [Candidatus Kapaibacterium sp.]
MRIAVIGYGRTGREVERIALDRGHDVVLRCTSREPLHTSTAEFDVAIDFSVPDLVFPHVAFCLDRGLPIVIGTTGWHAHLPALRELARQTDASIVYGSNFSMGMHVFRGLVASLARQLDASEEYDIAIHETHHRRKADAPSGTALTLAGIVMDGVERKTRIQTAVDGGVAPEALSVSSLRVGEVAGEHDVTADSPDDAIILTHRAKNRQGFARGAVRAAEWIVGNKGLHDVADVFDAIMGFRA